MKKSFILCIISIYTTIFCAPVLVAHTNMYTSPFVYDKCNDVEYYGLEIYEEEDDRFGTLYVLKPAPGVELKGEIKIPGRTRYPDETSTVHTAVKRNSFKECTEITSIVCEVQQKLERFQEIGGLYISNLRDSAFYAMPKLQKVQYRGTIWPHTFENCPELTTFTTPLTYWEDDERQFSGQTIIVCENAFANCPKLEVVDVSAIYAHDSAFYNCVSFKLDTVGILQAGCRAFYNCKSITKVFTPYICKYGWGDIIYDKYGCVIDAPEYMRVTDERAWTEGIGESAFEGCTSLTEIDLQVDGDEKIGKSAFEGCTSLTKINLESGYKIERNAFRNCENLETLTLYLKSSGYVGQGGAIIPFHTTSLGRGAFYGCVKLRNAVINNCNIIYNGAFYNCHALESISLPADLTSIGELAFAGCDNVKEVYVYASEPPATYDNFFSTYTATLYVPFGTSEAYRQAEGWRNFSNIVEKLENTSGITYAQNNSINIRTTATGISVTGNNGGEQVNVYDISGRQVYSGYDNNIALPQGLYIVKVGNKYTSKVLL